MGTPEADFTCTHLFEWHLLLHGMWDLPGLYTPTHTFLQNCLRLNLRQIYILNNLSLFGYLLLQTQGTFSSNRFLYKLREICGSADKSKMFFKTSPLQYLLISFEMAATWIYARLWSTDSERSWLITRERAREKEDKKKEKQDWICGEDSSWCILYSICKVRTSLET